MANIKSSKKAIKVIAKKTDNNHELKARVKNYIRLCDKAIEAGEKDNAQELLAKKNTANRQKSRLSSKVKEMA